MSDSAPTRVYIGTDAGVYVLKTLSSEATAYLKDDGAGNITLDDSAAAENRYLYLVDSTNNLVII